MEYIHPPYQAKALEADSTMSNSRRETATLLIEDIKTVSKEIRLEAYVGACVLPDNFPKDEFMSCVRGEFG